MMNFRQRTAFGPPPPQGRANLLGFSKISILPYSVGVGGGVSHPKFVEQKLLGA